MNVLLAISDLQRADLLSNVGKEAGFDCQLSTGGLYALTMLERERPDAIVSSADLDDMSGFDFYDIVRSDDAMNTLHFILLDESKENNIAPHDHVLPATSDPETIFRTLKTLSDSPPQVERKGNLSSNPINEHISGTLEIITLYDLVISLTQNQSTSKLKLYFGRGEAAILIHEGKIIHAEFASYTGEKALFRIFERNERNANTAFVIEHLDPKADLPKKPTITKPVSQLLLEVAVDLDHRRGNSKVKGR